MTNAVERKDLVVNYEEYHVEWYINGSKRGKKNKRVVDVCLFPVNSCYGKAGEYEVVFMTGEGKTLDEYHTYDLGEAVKAYVRMVRTNCPESWKALIDDLKAAKLIAEAAMCDDGGSCNFDSPVLRAPEGMTYQQVQACCKVAGVSCYDWKPFKKGEKLAVIGCTGIGQANRRTEGAEAACAFLQSKGYKCGMHYQLD